MTLTDFLTKHPMDRDEFARRVGVDPITVYRWEKGQRFPRDHLDKITKITRGKVTFTDFLGALPTKKSKQPAGAAA